MDTVLNFVSCNGIIYKGNGNIQSVKCDLKRGISTGDALCFASGGGGSGRRRDFWRNGGDSDGNDSNNESNGMFMWITLFTWSPRRSIVARAEEKLKIVTTTTIIHDLARHISGDRLDIVGLIKPGDDPHVYEPVPMDSVLIENCDVLLFNGFDLESNLMPLILNASPSTRKYPVGESVSPLPSSDESGLDTPDPHVWNDAQNAIAMVNAICRAFCEVDPAFSREYEKRAAHLNRDLKELDIWIKKSIQSIPASQRLLVTTHDAFQYYAKAYGLTIPGTLLGINTEEQPSAKVMFSLIEEIRRVKPPAVFFEKTVSSVLIKAVAEDAQVKLCEESLYSDSIGPNGSGAETYSKMMAYNTRVIVSALGGKTPPAPLAWANPP